MKIYSLVHVVSGIIVENIVTNNIDDIADYICMQLGWGVNLTDESIIQAIVEYELYQMKDNEDIKLTITKF